MSKGVPISERPDLKDASLSARLDAVFGSLGPAPAAGGWSLRQDVQPFKAGGGIEEYNYSSDEEDPNEGLKPLMPSRLVDSDDEIGCERDCMPPIERADPDVDAEEAGFGREHSEVRAARERERMRATLSSRRAFEAEAEEDEFDRVATGTMDLRNRLRDAKPPGFTEVPLDSAWERMHGRWQQQSEEQQQQQEMDIAMPDIELGGESGTAVATVPIAMGSSPAAACDEDKAGGAAASRKRFRSGVATAALSAAVELRHPSDEQQHRVQPQQSGNGVEMMQATTAEEDAHPDAPADAVVVGYGGEMRTTTDECPSRSGILSLASGVGITTSCEPSGPAAVPPAPSPPPPRQRGGRRVQWADFASGRPSDADLTPAGNGVPDGHANGSNGHMPPANEDSGRGGGDGGGIWGRGRGGGRARLDWQRRGFVPDHVRNPHKYTMYTLDEELVVGGGDRPTNSRNGRNGGTFAGGGGGGNERLRPGEDREGDNEMRQGLAQARQAVEAASRAEHDPERVETTFGSGIAFRPRTARQQLQPQSQAANQPSQHHGDGGERGPPDGAISRLPGICQGLFATEDDEAEDPGDGEYAGATPMSVMRNGARSGGGQRHFRARPRQTDEYACSRVGGVMDGGDAMQQD